MIRVSLFLFFLFRSTLLIGQEYNTEKFSQSSFYVLPKVEVYRLTWMVKGKEFLSKLSWDNNFRSGAYIGYQRLISDKIFFSEIGLLSTITGRGIDIDKFSSGAEMESEFQSDKSTLINLKIGAELISKRKERLKIVLNVAKDNLKLRSNKVSDLDSRYDLRKFDICANYNYSFTIAHKICDVGIQSGIGYNYAIATWNKIESLKQPKSFDHSLTIYNVGIKAAFHVFTTLSVDILFSSDSLIKGRERTFLKDGGIQNLDVRIFNNRLLSLGLKYRIL